MNNIKKIALGLLVGAMAIGFSAFTNATAKKSSGAFTIWYYTLGSDQQTYTRVGTSGPDENNCVSAQSPKCVIGFSSDKGAHVNANSLPATPSYQSATNGVYNP
jgi:hypothetical protein